MEEISKTRIISIIKDLLSIKDEIIFAYIFGSFVFKEENFHDVDVALYLNKDFNKNDYQKYPYGYESGLISQLTSYIRKPVDVLVMNKSEIAIQQRIVNKGILLFSKDDTQRINYENYIRKLYIDTESLRKIKRHYLRKKILNA